MAPAAAATTPTKATTTTTRFSLTGPEYHGPYTLARMNDGQRVYWIDGGWHRNEWRGGAYPGSITFHNGGYYRGGRYDGFNDADPHQRPLSH